MSQKKVETRRRKIAQRTELVVVVVLLLISFLHLLRLLNGTEISIGGSVIPIWTSIFGCVGPALLLFLFRWSHKQTGA